MTQIESFRHFSHRTIDDSFFCCRREKLFAASELQLIIRKNIWTKFRIVSALHQSAAYFWWLIRQNHSNDSAINSLELMGFEWTSNYNSKARVSNYFVEFIVTLISWVINSILNNVLWFDWIFWKSRLFHILNRAWITKIVFSFNANFKSIRLYNSCSNTIRLISLIILFKIFLSQIIMT